MRVQFRPLPNRPTKSGFTNSSSDRSRLPLPGRIRTIFPDGGFQCLLMARAPYTALG
jgi:hypothetical protein